MLTKFYSRSRTKHNPFPMRERRVVLLEGAENFGVNQSEEPKTKEKPAEAFIRERRDESYKNVFESNLEQISTRQLAEAYEAVFERIPNAIKGKFVVRSREIDRTWNSAINYRNEDGSRPRYRVSIQIANYVFEDSDQVAHLSEHDATPILIIVDGTPANLKPRQNPDGVRMRYEYMTPEAFPERLEEIVDIIEDTQPIDDNFYNRTMAKNPDSDGLMTVERDGNK